MALAKRTEKGTVFANTFRTKDEVGLFMGIYHVASVVSLGTLDGELVLLINDDSIERASVRILHTDKEWNPKEG